MVSDPALWTRYGVHMLTFFHFSTMPQYPGLPSSVVDLTAEQQECGIFISWEPPYLLLGLSVSCKVYANGR